MAPMSEPHSLPSRRPCELAVPQGHVRLSCSQCTHHVPWSSLVCSDADFRSRHRLALRPLRWSMLEHNRPADWHETPSFASQGPKGQEAAIDIRSFLQDAHARDPLTRWHTSCRGQCCTHSELLWQDDSQIEACPYPIYSIRFCLPILVY